MENFQREVIHKHRELVQLRRQIKEVRKYSITYMWLETTIVECINQLQGKSGQREILKTTLHQEEAFTQKVEKVRKFQV